MGAQITPLAVEAGAELRQGEAGEGGVEVRDEFEGVFASGEGFGGLRVGGEVFSANGPAEPGPFLVGVGRDDVDPLAVTGLVGVLEGVRRLLPPPLEGVLSGVEGAGQVSAYDPEAHVEQGSRDLLPPACSLPDPKRSHHTRQ